MKSYIGELFDIFKVKSENRDLTQEQPKIQAINEDVAEPIEKTHKDAIREILANMDDFRKDFKEKIMDPALGLKWNPSVGANDFKLGDKPHPHLRAIERLVNAIDDLEAQLRVQLSDPMENAEDAANMELPDASDASLELGGEIEISSESRVERIDETSYYYYKGMHPEVADELMQINGWTYAKNEIWDDQGLCSIIYEPEEDCIFIFELMDPDGIDQELVAKIHSVDELDDALTSFVELSEIAPEMKIAFAEYIEDQRNGKQEAAESPVEVKPVIVDGWEYIYSDPDFYGNPTLFKESEPEIVFIQKDMDPENPEPFLVMATKDSNETAMEFQASDLDSLCKWLEINDFSVPTEPAKDMFLGKSESAKDSKKKQDLPKDFKLAPDNPEISHLAPEVPAPEIAEVDKENK